MYQCPMCKSEIGEDNPAVGLAELNNYVKTTANWDQMESDRSFPVGKTFSVGGRHAQIAAKKTSYTFDDLDDPQYGLTQGDTFETYIVVRVGDNYFKKIGHGDSYGEITWDGDLVPVTPKVKTIEVFE